MKTQTARSARALRPFRAALACTLVVAGAAACGGSGGGGGSREAGEAPAVPISNSGDPSFVQNPAFLGGGGAVGQTAFEAQVYPLLRAYCTQCHVGAGPGFPHIAHPDPETAFRAVVDNQKVNLSMPANSRLVQRLIADQHHCWSNCDADGAAMQAGIEAWAAAVLAANPNTGGPTGATGSGTSAAAASGIITSEMRGFGDAVPIASVRYEENMVARWKFDEGAGTIANDTSSVAPTMNLALVGDVVWLSGGGLDLQGGKATSNPGDSKKLYNVIASGSGSQQYSVEAWVVPANTTQEGPARIITYANGTGARNFMLGQILYTYVFRNRSLTPTGNTNGGPDLVTNDADEDLQAQLQHVVMTYDQAVGRKIWVNGMWTEDPDPAEAALLVNWHPDYVFAIGNETSNNRPWLGQMKFLAIYNRALAAEQIQMNYAAGASQRYALRFPVASWLGAGSYVEFEVSEFDGYSYLFCFPTLVSPNPSGIQVETLRIGVNGVAPVASQSFRNVRVVVDEPRERLSNLCSVVPKDLGINGDTFEVWFDVLGTNVNRLADAAPNPPPPPATVEVRPDVGLRDFAMVNDTMAAVTGVDPLVTQPTFDELTQQLPSSSDARTFVSSHQVAISKLALEYCDTLVETPALRSQVFGSFPFGQTPTAVFGDPANRAALTNALVSRMVGSTLTSQPDAAEVGSVLGTLVDALVAPCATTPCAADRTATIVKAACAAVLASGAVQLQ
jgi:hypothetical protein